MASYTKKKILAEWQLFCGLDFKISEVRYLLKILLKCLLQGENIVSIFKINVVLCGAIINYS